MVFCVFFFFKQKTAYEMRISDWSSDVCSSDLVINGDRPRGVPMVLGHESSGEVVEVGPGVDDLCAGDHVVTVFVTSCGCCFPCLTGRPALCEPGAQANRSEECRVGKECGSNRRYRWKPYE